MELKMEVTQKQILSQHMIQSMEILQMSTAELESYIENLSLENPVVDLEHSYENTDKTATQIDLQRKLDWLESTDRQNHVYYQQDRDNDSLQDSWNISDSGGEQLSEYLMAQLITAPYSSSEREIVNYLILSLDSRGYLTEDIVSVARHFHTDIALVENLLEDIQALDPAGVGARDLKECLLLQVHRLQNFSEMTEELIKNHLEDIGKNHLASIAKQLHVSVEEIQEACQQIRSLNPKPGNAFSDREQLRYITPDIFVVKLEKSFEILVNEYQYPKFSINDYYQHMLKENNDAEVQKYLSQKIQQAQWVQNCISQRSSTLSRVTHVIVEKQQDFFLHGPLHNRPMKLSDIASQLDLHESTVSRAMRGKYLQCSWGVFPLNYFLTASVSKKSSGSGAGITPMQIKEVMKQIIDEEDKKKPYSDRIISEELEKRDIHLSRRTVAKYREELGIPDKSGRKSWQA